jgi:c-di-GMP-binding flagellar brake protein YcgR
VTDSDARTLHPIVHRLGYRFVVRRPVHPEALRTLMRQALHRDSGRRSAPRVAIGCRASWKLARTLRRREGTLVDLSAGSCQLLVDDKVPMGSRIRIRIPALVTGQRRIDVGGRVVRRGAVSRKQRAFGVVFEDLSQRMQEQLSRLVEALESGPSRFDGCVEVEVETSIAAIDAAETAPPHADDDETPRSERRRAKRAAFQRELVALDVGTEEVRLSLIGRDLSIGGMRVEPNPELAIDDHLRLAFYDCEDGEPLLLHAVVTRIDGRLGACLRFIGLEPEARARLARSIDELPPIESVEGAEPEGAWAAIGQVELLPEPLD